MMPAYLTRQIAEDQIEVAFLLVEAAECAISRHDWMAFCKRVIEWRGTTGLYEDVVVATDPAGRVRGLFVAETVQSLLFGRVFHVPVFVTASAADEDGLIVELLATARAMARRADCREVRIWAPGGSSWNRVTTELPAASNYSGVQLKLA